MFSLFLYRICTKVEFIEYIEFCDVNTIKIVNNFAIVITLYLICNYD